MSADHEQTHRDGLQQEDDRFHPYARKARESLDLFRMNLLPGLDECLTRLLEKTSAIFLSLKELRTAKEPGAIKGAHEPEE